MSYESRAYDKINDDGLPPDPVAIVVAIGTWDVSRLLNALVRGNTETGKVAEQLRRKVNRHYGGRAALALLKRHGGADLTTIAPDAVDDRGAFWAAPDGTAVTAQPIGDVKATSPHGSLRLDLEAARQLADRLWAAADYAEAAQKTTDEQKASA